MSDVYLEGRKTQQHRLEKLVKAHLLECQRAEASTELEKVMRAIISQFIDAVKAEEKELKDFDSIYLK